MNLATRLLWLAAASAVLGGCDLVDPMRPMPHPDTEIFGNLLEVTSDPGADGVWIATLRAGVPRALGRADESRPTPDVDEGIVATVTVTRDTVVTVGGELAAVEDIGPGTEVVAIPVPGTTTMIGEKDLRFEAGQLMDFATYARWRLPKLELAGNRPPVENPDRINSDGVEHAPVPVGDGRVLYFAARLRRPVTPGDPWVGARRDGIRPANPDERVFERSYRTELGPDGWTRPEIVEIPGTQTAEQVQVTWVDRAELSCLVTVAEPGGEPWVGRSVRSSTDRPWETVEPVEAAGGGDAYDAVVMFGSPARMVFATNRDGSSDIYLHDPEFGPAQRLQPAINTGGMEWSARVGPDNELYFVRGDRQLRFQDGRVHEVRLPGPHRVVVIEAAPTADGRWLFMTTPRLRPVELDLDILVAPLAADGLPGPAIAVDDWRP
jgi:hypothetical protein